MDEWIDYFTLKDLDLTTSNKCLVIHSGNRCDNTNKPIDPTIQRLSNRLLLTQPKSRRVLRRSTSSTELSNTFHRLWNYCTYLHWSYIYFLARGNNSTTAEKTVWPLCRPEQKSNKSHHSQNLECVKPRVKVTWLGSNLCKTYRFVC